VNAWILGKFAVKLKEELTKLSVDVDIGDRPDRGADINHHIIFQEYDGSKNNIDTLMVTHVDTVQKMNQLRRQMKTAELAVCMSAESKTQLINAGIPAEKVCYVNPCHDGVMKPRPLKIGICTRVYNDGRKREYLLEKIAGAFSADDYSFIIMGAGWDKQVNLLRENGFEVTYHNEFNYDEYIKLIPELDYYLYTGLDEGQMGFVDALSAGVRTIVPPVGYHLDVSEGITHPYSSENELIDVLRRILERRKRRIDLVTHWTWRDYALKHHELWQYLLNGRKKITSCYPDGVNSINTKGETVNFKTIAEEYKKLVVSPVAKKQRIRHIIYSFAPFKIVMLYKKIKKNFRKNR